MLAAEELIASKLFVNFRERFDGADVVHIIHGKRGKLDWNRIRQLVGEHWEILLWEFVLFHYVYPAKKDYVPHEVWNDLLHGFTTTSSLHPPIRHSVAASSTKKCSPLT